VTSHGADETAGDEHRAPCRRGAAAAPAVPRVDAVGLPDRCAAPREDDDVDRGIDVLVRALAEDGPTSRDDLYRRFASRREGPGRFGDDRKEQRMILNVIYFAAQITLLALGFRAAVLLHPLRDPGDRRGHRSLRTAAERWRHGRPAGRARRAGASLLAGAP